MIKKLLVLILVGILGSIGTGFTQGPDLIPPDRLDRILLDASTNFSAVKTMKTLLTQEKTISIFSETIISKGLCLFKSPGKLRLDFTEPFRSSLIVADNQVHKYDYFNGAWKKLNPGNKEMMLIMMNHITSWLNGRFNDNGMYTVSGFYMPDITLVLTPKNHEFANFIQSFELGLNSDLNGLDHIIIHETEKDFTRILFHNDRINEEIPDILFDGSQDAPYPVPQW